MTTIWYFPLESIKSRYTKQLCKEWIPNAIKQYLDGKKFVPVVGVQVDSQIKVGQVLDATGRGIYGLTQCACFLKHIELGSVKDGDVLYIQDFWTPGLEAIAYALHLYNLKIKVYSMLHAQSVDEFDFTYDMRDWMRPIELGYDKLHMTGGIFVASTIHKKQLRRAGFKAPIHVVSLPFSYVEVKKHVPLQQRMKKEKAVVFCSRFDKEKNPEFMLEVAETFLMEHKDWKFYVTTSAKEFRSNVPGFVDAMKFFAQQNKRFKMEANLSKDDFYKILCKSKIQLNTSWQDYVSWTLLEAVTFGCDIAYPNFRSFKECIPKDRRYKPNNLKSALKILERCIQEHRRHDNIAQHSDFGRLCEAAIICNGPYNEVNIWKDVKWK